MNTRKRVAEYVRSVATDMGWKVEYVGVHSNFACITAYCPCGQKGLSFFVFRDLKPGWYLANVMIGKLREHLEEDKTRYLTV